MRLGFVKLLVPPFPYLLPPMPGVLVDMVRRKSIVAAITFANFGDDVR